MHGKSRTSRSGFPEGILRGKITFLTTDFYLFLAAVFWGTTFFFGKTSLREFPPLTLAALTTVISSLVLIPVFLVEEKEWRVSPRHFLWLFGLAFLGTIINRMSWATGLYLTTASNSALLLSTTPLFGLIASILISRTEATLRLALGLLISFGGVSLVIGGDGKGWTLASETFRGDLILLSSALAWALFSVLSRSLLKAYSSLKVTTYVSFIGGLFYIPILMFDQTAWAKISGQAWFGVFYMAILGQCLAYLFWVRGIQHIGSLRTLLYQYLIPVVTILLSVPLLGDVLTVSQILGAAIVLGGLLTARSG